MRRQTLRRGTVVPVQIRSDQRKDLVHPLPLVPPLEECERVKDVRRLAENVEELVEDVAVTHEVFAPLAHRASMSREWLLARAEHQSTHLLRSRTQLREWTICDPAGYLCSVLVLLSKSERLESLAHPLERHVGFTNSLAIQLVADLL